jgi:hypothetical protein
MLPNGRSGWLAVFPVNVVDEDRHRGEVVERGVWSPVIVEPQPAAEGSTSLVVGAVQPGIGPLIVRRRIERAVADGAPQQLKRLLDSVVDQIVVESRACIQPYFVAPTVRTRIDQRRRTGIEPA